MLISPHMGELWSHRQKERIVEIESITWTDSQLAKLLQVSVPTVRRMWWRKQLPPPVRIGHVNRWRKSDIELWLAELPIHDLYEAENACERKLA